jgi:HPr kinase/phosphorylase
MTPTAPPTLTVARLLEDGHFGLQLELITGEEGLDHRISNSRIQKPGLALTGFTEHLHPERVQVFGNTEVSYLRTLTEEEQASVLEKLFDSRLACVVVTKGLDIPKPLLDGCQRARLALIRTPLVSSAFIIRIQSFLEDALTTTGSIHGVLVDVFGIGVLILGKSGIGKSELALDLVMHGHRLVADDIVNYTRRQGEIHGSGNQLIRHHMEIRGLGILNIKDLFGVASVRERKKIELVIELLEWAPNSEYDRLGLDAESINFSGVELPHAVVPVRPGRNLTTIVEVAARNHLLKMAGHNSAQEFAERLNQAIARSQSGAGERPGFPAEARDHAERAPSPDVGHEPRPSPFLGTDETGEGVE